MEYSVKKGYRVTRWALIITRPKTCCATDIAMGMGMAWVDIGDGVEGDENPLDGGPGRLGRL